jgi:sec-independent protein translocase protein TatA
MECREPLAGHYGGGWLRKPAVIYWRGRGDAMFGSFGYGELLVILVIVLVLFGATRVPQLMRGIGLGIREFKSAVKDDEPPQKPAADEPPKNEGSKPAI